MSTFGKKTAINIEFFDETEFNFHLSRYETSFDFEYEPLNNQDSNIFLSITTKINDKNFSVDIDFNKAIFSNKALCTRTNNFMDLKTFISILNLNNGDIPKTKIEAFEIIFEFANFIKNSISSNSKFTKTYKLLKNAEDKNNTKKMNEYFETYENMLPEMLSDFKNTFFDNLVK